MTIPLFRVDAFAEHPFSGNPAAVCLLDRSRDEAWMRAVARELAAPATAFVAGDELRWFSPHGEIALCGHGTLAAAHVLATERGVEGEITFRTMSSGVLRARAEDGWVTLDLPADPLELSPLPDDVGRTLGAPVLTAWRGRIGFVAELPDEDAVRSVRPDPSVLARYPDADVIVTAAGGQRDFVSRCFVPGVGEDAVTGSAHCALGPLWAARLGRVDVAGYQASARGGVVHVRVEGDRVGVRGRAITIARGALLG